MYSDLAIDCETASDETTKRKNTGHARFASTIAIIFFALIFVFAVLRLSESSSDWSRTGLENSLNDIAHSSNVRKSGLTSTHNYNNGTDEGFMGMSLGTSGGQQAFVANEGVDEEGNHVHKDPEDGVNVVKPGKHDVLVCGRWSIPTLLIRGGTCCYFSGGLLFWLKCVFYG